MKFWLFTLIISLSVQHSTSALDYENFEYYTEILQTGTFYDIAIEGNRLYAATLYGLAVLDISNPENPAYLARVPSDYNSRHITVKDGIVYLVDEYWGIHAYDTNDIDDIQETYDFSNQAYIFEDVLVHENRLYACVVFHGIRIYDIDDPSNPSFLNLARNVSYPASCCIVDSLTYIIDWENCLTVADLRNTHRTVTLNRLDLNPAILLGITYANDLLFISNGSYGLKIYDISDRVNPSHVSDVYFNEEWVYSAAVQGNYAYVGLGSGGGLKVLDISDPEEPQVVFSDDTTFYFVSEIVFNEGYAYIAAGSDGLATLNIEELDNPELMSHYTPPRTVYSYSLYADWLFVARYDEGLLVYDIHDPANPEALLTIDSLQVYRTIATEDGWLYLTAGCKEDTSYYFKAWDIRDPEDPEETWCEEIAYPVGLFDIEGGVLCAQLEDSSVTLYDIYESSQPEFMRSIDNIDPSDINLDGDRLYITSWDGYLYIYDISDLEFPELLGDYYGFEYTPYGISASGDTAFVADVEVRVLDVSKPEEILPISTISTEDFALDLYISGIYLYVCDYYGGLRVFDVTPEEQIHEVGFCNTPGTCRDVVIHDRIAYVGDTYDLTICRFLLEQSIDPSSEFLGSDFRILPAYPNPFNSTTNIRYQLPVPGHLVLTILDINGRELEKLVDGRIEAGYHRTVWDASGSPSGIYFYRLEAGTFTSTRKLILIK